MNYNYVAGTILFLILLFSVTIPWFGVFFWGFIFLAIFLDWLSTRNTPPAPIYDLDHTLSDYHPSISEEARYANFMMLKSSYMHSLEWKNKRMEVLLNCNFTCQACGSTGALEIHHISGYNQIPNESLRNLSCLCRDCHQRQHDHYGYPQTYKDYMNWYAPVI